MMQQLSPNSGKIMTTCFFFWAQQLIFYLRIFGSARVLIDRIRNWRPNDNVMDLLYSTLRFLLLGEVYKPTWGAKNYIIYHEAVFKHFNFGDSPQAIYRVASPLIRGS